jgi:hypothetical protein
MANILSMLGPAAKTILRYYSKADIQVMIDEINERDIPF